MNFPASCLSAVDPTRRRAGAFARAVHISLGTLLLLLPLSAFPGEPPLQLVLAAQSVATTPTAGTAETVDLTADDFLDAELKRINTLLVLHILGVSVSIDDGDVMRRRGMQRTRSGGNAGCSISGICPAYAHDIRTRRGSLKKDSIMLRILITAVTLAFLVTGCNTMSGVGKDIERGGEKLQGSAERNK